MATLREAIEAIRKSRAEEVQQAEDREADQAEDRFEWARLNARQRVLEHFERCEQFGSRQPQPSQDFVRLWGEGRDAVRTASVLDQIEAFHPNRIELEVMHDLNLGVLRDDPRSLTDTWRDYEQLWQETGSATVRRASLGHPEAELLLPGRCYRLHLYFRQLAEWLREQWGMQKSAPQATGQQAAAKESDALRSAPASCGTAPSR